MATDLDLRSHARKMVDQLRDAVEKLNIGIKSYTIGTRVMTKRDIPEILQMLQRYERLLAQEDAAAAVASGLANPRRVFVRLNRI